MQRTGYADEPDQEGSVSKTKSKPPCSHSKDIHNQILLRLERTSQASSLNPASSLIMLATTVLLKGKQISASPISYTL